MARDNEQKPSDAHARAEDYREETAADDPLVELARIVNRNKPAGNAVTSDRVGSTDYFAGLDDFSEFGGNQNEKKPASDEPVTSRVESPEFARQPDEFVAPEPQSSETSDDYYTRYNEPEQNEPQQAPALGEVPSQRDQGDLSDIGLRPGSHDDPAADYVSGPQAPAHDSGYLDLHLSKNDHPAAPEGTENEAPEASTLSGFEDELIGAFHTSFGADRRESGERAGEEAPVSDDTGLDLQPREPFLPTQPVSVAPTLAADETPTPAPEEEPLDEDEDLFAETAPTQSDHEPAETIAEQPADIGVLGSVRPGTQEEPASSTSSIDDLFAELGQLRASALASSRANQTGASQEPAEEPDPAYSEPQVSGTAQQAGSSAYHASEPSFDAPAYEPRGEGDLEVTDSLTRAGETTPSDEMSYPDHEPEGDLSLERLRGEEAMQAGTASASVDIDDMAWPAAASRIPDRSTDEPEEEAPPPGGYDLEAVALAMQESDPTIGRSGVLPPHPPKEEAAAVQTQAKSRKGLFMAAAVLGVVVLGGASYLLLGSGDTVMAPDGPPPVIAGLQGPLKVMPEATGETEENAGSKLIYDRVDGNTEETSRERLILPEKTEPADLPPAPEQVVTTDPLVPGGPKKVRTLIVRPDGTIVSESSDGSQARVVDTTTTTPDPTTPAPGFAGTTTDVPVTDTVSSPDDPVPTPTPTETAPVPAAPETIDTASTAPDAATTPEAPEGPAVEGPANAASIVPAPKPDVPVQVARATPQPATPVASAPAPVNNNGPLNLNQQAAPQPAAPVTSGGSIPAGTYVVQVTSQRSEAAARESYADLQRRFPQVLGGQQAVIVSAVIEDRGTFYRARIPSASRDDAISLCERLQAAGGDCFVRRN